MVDIYLITNTLNGMQYVGKTVKSYLERWKEHCQPTSHTYISEAIHKYGKNNFRIELLKQVPEDEWKYWESYYIKTLHTYWTEGGYNLTWGGDSNPMDTPEIRQKHKEKMSSAEHRKVVSEASKKQWKEHPRGEDYKNKVRENNRKNADRVYSGFRDYNASQRQQVAETDCQGNILKVFDSLSDATAYCGKDPQSCSGLIKATADVINKNGKRARAYGRYWTMQL